MRPSLKAYRLTGWRSTSSVLNLTKGKKTLLFCKYLFTLQSCFKNMCTSLEQVNKPSYGMVTKAQQQTWLIRLTLTEIVRHTIKCSFIKMNLLAPVYVISNSKQFFRQCIYIITERWQEPIALTGAHRVDRSPSRWQEPLMIHTVFSTWKFTTFNVPYFSSVLYLVPNKKTRRSVWSSYVKTWNA